MDRLDMESKNIVSSNIEKIKELFPNVITELDGKEVIDFDSLKQELSEVIIDEKKEKYQLTWPGKKQAIVNVNSPITKTLRPIKEKSVDFDSTQNVYIEGDNLETLKLLQESYLNKIKCIYIDPPYNTGKDFVYSDNFNTSKETELLESGQINEDGNRLVSNNQSNGRFHSFWNSMIFSRLKLARNLLKEDGVIFISIDDNELNNLKKISDEIFGEANWIATVPRLTSAQRPSQESYISLTHDYILVYAKSKKFDFSPVIERNAKDIKEDKIGHYIDGDTSPILASSTQGYSAGGDYDVEFNGKTYQPVDSSGNRRRWLWTKDRMDKAIELGIVVETTTTLRVRNYIDREFQVGTNKMVEKNPNLVLTSFDLMNSNYANNRGTKRLNELGLGKYFDFSKPLDLIETILKLCVKDNDIVLDFFSGSATTADAVMSYNAKNNLNIKYIMVQLPEKCSEEFDTICDIGEERIRRASDKIKAETNANIDYGFRVYRVDDSNLKDVYYKPSDIQQTNLFDMMSNIKEDRTSEDLLTQVILDLGLTLDLPIEEKTIGKNKVYYVAENSLVACFDDTIDVNIIDEICECQPLKVVFKDSSFRTDKDKINLEERIKKSSSETKISIL